MLENLRRKSLVKTYNNPIHQVHFEQGLARYRNHVEIDVCTQKLSKELQESSFEKTIKTISKETFSFFKLTMIYCQKDRKKKIDRDFLLGETEITQELYQAVMNTNPSKFQNRPQNPVEMVSWENAIKFCNELSRLQGLELCYTENPKSLDFGWDCDFSKNGYRLPTEIEWEYAAKAGTENKWAGTNDGDKLEEYAWFDGDSSGSTHPVKTKKPNEWGFYDMSGNVMEWCWDKYNPRKKQPSDFRVQRGGSWCSSAGVLSSATRHLNKPGDSYRSDGDGFRVCRSIVN